MITNYRLPQHRESFIEIIENIAKQTIQLAKDAIKVLQSRIEQLFHDIYDRLFGIQQTGDDALNTLLSEIEKLSGNNEKGVSSCVQNHMEEIKQIVTSGREEIGKCILTAMGEADSISESLYPYVESIATLVKNITGVIEKCSTSTNPVSAAFCITQHVRFEITFLIRIHREINVFFLLQVTQVSDAISAIIRDSQEAIRLAIVQVNALVINTRGCVKTTTDTVKAAVEKIISECKTNAE